MAELTYNQVAKIKVFGVGGAGSNAKPHGTGRRAGC